MVVVWDDVVYCVCPVSTAEVANSFVAFEYDEAACSPVGGEALFACAADPRFLVGGTSAVAGGMFVTASF